METVLLAALILSDAGQMPNFSSPSTMPASADTFAAAHQRALDEGKPLIVWVGGNFCARCVDDSASEFVHHFAPDGWRGHRGPATVVLAPHGGNLWCVGVVTRWTVGSHDWGHVPSARRLVREWSRRAAVGRLNQLRLLNFGDGNWGWPADRASLPIGDRYPATLQPTTDLPRVRQAAPVPMSARQTISSGC